MKDTLHNFMGYIPFVLHTGNREGVRVQRIVEAIIIAAIAGGISTYAMTQVLDAKMGYLNDRINQVSSQIQQMHSDLYAPKR